MLVVDYIQGFDLILEHLLLVFLEHLRPQQFQLCQSTLVHCLLLMMSLNFLFKTPHLILYLLSGEAFVLALGEVKLTTEEFEGQVLILHVQLVDVLLNSDFFLELHIHLNLHRLQLVRGLFTLLSLGGRHASTSCPMVGTLLLIAVLARPA